MLKQNVIPFIPRARLRAAGPMDPVAISPDASTTFLRMQDLLCSSAELDERCQNAVKALRRSYGDEFVKEALMGFKDLQTSPWAPGDWADGADLAMYMEVIGLRVA